MNNRLVPFVNLAKDLMSEGKSFDEILRKLKSEGATFAISVKTLEKMGLDFDEIDEVLDQSEVWKDQRINLTDLFFDFVELDDDLIE